MKTYGIFRKIDSTGRLVLPKEMRDFYQIEENDFIEILSVEEGILLRKARPSSFKNKEKA